MSIRQTVSKNTQYSTIYRQNCGFVCIFKTKYSKHCFRRALCFNYDVFLLRKILITMKSILKEETLEALSKMGKPALGTTAFLGFCYVTWKFFDSLKDWL